MAGIRTQDEVHALRNQLAAKRGGQERKVVLSMRAAATMLGIGRGRVLNALLKSGQLRTVEINGRPKIPREDVERLAREGFTVDDENPSRRRPRRPKADVPRGGIRGIKL